MKRNFLVAAFISLVIFSCKKDEEQPDSLPAVHSGSSYTIPISAGLQPYKFKEGSYWVYQNDSTGVLDSIVVDSVSTAIIVKIPSMHGTTGQTQCEIYKMQMHDVSAALYYNNTLFNGGVIMQNFGGNWQDGFAGQPVYFTGDGVGASSRGTTVIASYPSITVNAVNFNTVTEVIIPVLTQYQHEFDYTTYFYYSDTVGLIKKESLITPTNIESWSIKRWHIIR